MGHYIDAEKLIAEIERWRDKAKEKYNKNAYSMGRCDALAEFRNHIVSLLEEQPEFVNKIWHKVSEEANLTRPVVLSDGDKYMSPPCTFPFKDMPGFVNAMNKRYKADYTIWAYMDDLLGISSLQQERPELPPIGYAKTYYQRGLHDGVIKGRMEILKGLEEIEKRKAEPVLVIKEQELPEVVWEKEIDKEINMERKKLIEVFGPMNGEQSIAIRKFAHRIYELGLKARNL